ncbi:MAG: hypothetical protein HY815_08825, partial [Candidatus Riflebacteria bacterium]|nr:hypothetical protein [Candidatus Riflebacteria bacterium]
MLSFALVGHLISFCVVVLAAVVLARPGAAQNPAPAPSPARIPAARIVVTSGLVFLNAKSGKPIVIPDKFDLCEGDVITTPSKIAGQIVLLKGGSLPLAPLRRYRIGREAIQEPSGTKGWKTIPMASPEAPVRVDGPDRPPPKGGLIAKVRAVSGPVFLRAEAWPQEIAVTRAASMSIGDDLRVGKGARAQLFLTTGGWIYLLGPALVTLLPDSIQVDSGEGMAKALGDRTMVAGPYRLDAGPNAFTFRTTHGGLEVAAIGGIVAVVEKGAGSQHLAPGRRGTFRTGGPPRIVGIDIRREAARYESLFDGSSPAPAPQQGADRTDEVVADRKKERRDEKRSRARTDGSARPDGPSEPRIEARFAPTLGLRDRVKGLDSPRSRYFYCLKLEEREARAQADAVEKQFKDRTPDEIQALRLYKVTREALRASQSLNDFRHSKELGFEERLLLKPQDRDREIRSERERLFGEPLFLLTRRLLPTVAADRTRARAQADQFTFQIGIAQQLGATPATIADLEKRRQKVLD